MVEIPLRNRAGEVVAATLVDDADAERVLAVGAWCRTTHGYVTRRNIGYLHRWLLGLAPGDPRQADHVNRDRLDNRRANLRIVTGAENASNVVANRNSTSTHRGVHLRRGKWIAQAQQNKRRVHLGTFATEQEAADAVSAHREGW